MAENELIDQVDENNKIIGPVVRADAHARGLWHRSIHVWVYSKSGKVLLQRRSFSKSDAPGKLDMAIGGHIKAGQSVGSALVDEAKEELGVTLTTQNLDEPIIIAYDRPSEQMPEPHRQFVYVYFVEMPEDTKFIFNDGEVEEIKWISLDEFTAVLKHGELYKDFAYHSDEYFKLIVKTLKVKMM